MTEAEVVIEIPFHDVDIVGVVWHGHYLKYLEIERCALLEKIDYNYPQMKASGYAWPVIDVRIRYPHPLYFQQKVKVKARLDEWENRLKIKYLIEDVETGQRLTKASTVQVAINMETGEMLYVSPNILFEKLGIVQ
jgi:acyl-CoA thioester hydrolase